MEEVGRHRSQSREQCRSYCRATKNTKVWLIITVAMTYDLRLTT